MLTLPAARWTQPELVRRIAVTLAVLALFRAGGQVPLPGLDATLLFSHADGTRGSAVTIGLVSIMTLGITPLLSALILVEMTKTFWPRFSAWAEIPSNEHRIEQASIATALVLAALQATGLAIALEDVVGLAPEPGFAFRVGIVVALTAATAVVMWLAAVITQHGIGHGFWILLMAPLIATTTQSVVERAGDYSAAGPTSIALFGVLLIASTAALTALCKARPPLCRPVEAAWANILGLILVAWLVTGAWLALVLLAPEHAPPLEEVASHDRFLVLGLAGIALVAALRFRRQRASGTPSLAAAVPLIATLIGLVVFGTLLSHISDASLILPPTKVLLLAAAGLIVQEGVARPDVEPATLPSPGAVTTPDIPS